MMSKKPVAYCGYRCDLCPAHTKNVERIANRTTIRKGWNTFFDFDIPEEEILCVGCRETGNHLDTQCLVRPCALSKHLQDCSDCDVFDSCETLLTRADIVEKIKKEYPSPISKEDYELFFRPYEGRKELKKRRKTR
jgi:Protein of unknown function (DUF3795)